MGEPSLRIVPAAPDPDTVLARLAPMVLGWCRRLGAGRVDAEETAQEVLWVVARRLPTLRDPDAIDPWVFRVTANTVRRHGRRAWWRRWMGAPSEALPGGRSPEHAHAARELAGLVDTALHRLPDAQREVLVLCLVEERTDVETARLLGIAPGTVKSRLRLARARFVKVVAADPALAPLLTWIAEEEADGGA